VRELFRIRICVIVLCFICTISCAPISVDFLENKPEISSSPTPELLSKENDDQIINESGWQIPPTKDMIMGKPVYERMKSINGRSFRVKRSPFIPDKKVSFTEPGFSKNLTRLDGKLGLFRVTEFSFKGKAFLYFILIRKSVTNNNSTQDVVADEYGILDTDGDGKFETLIEDLRSCQMLWK
jgi:hypothetical protein